MGGGYHAPAAKRQEFASARSEPEGSKLYLAKATKVPCRIDGDPAIVVVVVVVIVIENPGEGTDYEDEDDEKDESGKAQDTPVITA